MSANAMHLATTNEAFSPRHIAAAMTKALGGWIDLDPASCLLANTVMGAKHIYTIDDDGLSKPWGPANATHRFGEQCTELGWNVGCNPPGGKMDGNKSRTTAWWKHGVSEWLHGRVRSMCWVAFKLDFLAITQSLKDVPVPLDFPICYPHDRLAYLMPQLPGPTALQPSRKPSAKQLADFAETGLCTGASPPHASAIIFLPNRYDLAGSIRLFRDAFDGIGAIVFDRRRLNKAVKFEA
jgi:hypothetical protein